MNQRFVDIVRKSGGNNEKRHLLIAGYNTDIDLTCDEMFKMPNDPINRMAVSVHYYTPSTFAILEEDASWGKAKTTWGNKKDVAELEKYMDMLKTTFYDKGVPVIIGEYGCAQKNKTAEMVNLYLTSVCKAAYERGLCPVLWDVTDAHYNREECKFIDNNLLEGLMSVKEAK
jgi:endoglucanase